MNEPVIADITESAKYNTKPSPSKEQLEVELADAQLLHRLYALTKRHTGSGQRYQYLQF